MTHWIAEKQEKAAATVRDILARPMPEDGMFGCDDTFDPWAIFPALYGSYSSDFDDCAVDVLSELLDRNLRRNDLAAEMLREMLCTSDLCDYGTSPRVCFPTQQFKELLPALIEKWKAYAALKWAPPTPEQRI